MVDRAKVIENLKSALSQLNKAVGHAATEEWDEAETYLSRCIEDMENAKDGMNEKVNK